ncbi:MAG TPA: CDP-diacylglycerol--glycerol-3-phosphate 3-phosphatidyltransferase [Candidatus Dormibacteraeota bacterium]|nr:CDP-diacylglycerol--glycerol-3-phosphate 3-phosphatidyltransferase [Candidatus Dormibacteraeota bacterium]
MNLPNALTLSRVVAIPILMVLLLVAFPHHDQIAAAVFLIASATDLIDGNLARASGTVTEMGKFLDPLADKLFVLSVLIALVQIGLLPAWVVVIIFSRELLITVLRSLRADRGVVAATPFGKTKTVLQIIAVTLLILSPPYPVLHIPALVAIGVALVFTVASGLDYLWRFRDIWWGTGRAAAQAAEPETAADTGSPAGPLVPAIAERLTSLGLRLATAESCTGGLLGGSLTELPGSSNWFKGGIVAYANEVKEAELGVPAEVLSAHGAVSAETARAMAEGVRRRLQADWGVAITGIAGPGSDGTDKPVGLTHIWLDGPGQSQGRRFVFDGDRRTNRRSAVQEALTMVAECLGALDRSNARS